MPFELFLDKFYIMYNIFEEEGKKEFKWHWYFIIITKWATSSLCFSNITGGITFSCKVIP